MEKTLFQAFCIVFYGGARFAPLRCTKRWNPAIKNNIGLTKAASIDIDLIKVILPASSRIFKNKLPTLHRTDQEPKKTKGTH